MQDNVSDREAFQEPFRVPRKWKTRGSRWAALGVGCLFAAIGLVTLVESVSHFDDFSIRARFVPREQVSRRHGTDKSPRQHGFGYGLGAFLGMVFASAGVSSAAAPFLGTTGRQRLAFVVAVLWHSLGIYTCWCYVSLAPKPCDTWPLLAVGIYEWFGLIPMASAVSEARFPTESRMVEKREQTQEHTINEHEPQPRRFLVCWLWRVVYIISPTAIGVPLLAIVGDGRMFGWGNVFVFGCILAVLPAGWILFVTILLSVKWRDFVFLVWGSPLALFLLWLTFY